MRNYCVSLFKNKHRDERIRWVSSVEPNTAIQCIDFLKDY